MSALPPMYVDTSIDRAQRVTIVVLLALFSVLVALLALVFGVAICGVCQAFALLRLMIRLASWYIGRFQDIQAEYQARARARLYATIGA